MHSILGELSFSLSHMWPGGHATGRVIPLNGHIDPLGQGLQVVDMTLS
jgi:hypothetical protein